MTLAAELKRLNNALDRLPPEESTLALERLTEKELAKYERLVQRAGRADHEPLDLSLLSDNERAEWERLETIATPGAPDSTRDLLAALSRTRGQWPCQWAKDNRGAHSPLEDAYRALESALDTGDQDRIHTAMQQGPAVLATHVGEKS
jgi:hypothetical protein